MSADYRRFLGRREERVLAYFGGDAVADQDRELRVPSRVPPGWWRFTIAGRVAEPVEPAEPRPEVLERLPAVSGHWTGALLVHGTARAEPLALLPAETPARFAPCRARRWWSDELLLEAVEFESEAEDAARRAFEDRGSLAEVRGAAATLRAAFAYAVFGEVQRELRLPASPLELRPALGAVAEGGWPAAERELRRLQAERDAEAARAAVRVREAARQAVQRAARESAATSRSRAEQALLAAGGRLLDARALGEDLMEVTYRFLGERFTSVVRAGSLQVVDAGLCLAGADEEVTLESLPSVIREAVESGQLVITRGHRG